MSLAVMCEKLSAQTGNEVGVVTRQCSPLLSRRISEKWTVSSNNMQIQSQPHQSVVTSHYDGASL